MCFVEVFVFVDFKLGAVVVEVGQFVESLGFGVEQNDVSGDVRVLVPVGSLEAIGSQNVNILLPGILSEAGYFLEIA